MSGLYVPDHPIAEYHVAQPLGAMMHRRLNFPLYIFLCLKGGHDYDP